MTDSEFKSDGKAVSYTVCINTPGYLPDNDDWPVFETAREAWEYLAAERRNQEEDLEDSDEPYSETAHLLDAFAAHGAQDGTVYGDTPGYGGRHDLGIAYTVTQAEESR